MDTGTSERGPAYTPNPVLRDLRLARGWGRPRLARALHQHCTQKEWPSPGQANIGIIGAALALGVMCTGVAYIIDFKQVEDVGATSALTVTFLNPLFGILWGALFLHEVVGWYTIAGAAVVIVGTALVTGYSPRPAARVIVPNSSNSP